jgi:hypothetical protein
MLAWLRNTGLFDTSIFHDEALDVEKAQGLYILVQAWEWQVLCKNHRGGGQ